jgi:hypothetical protein
VWHVDHYTTAPDGWRRELASRLFLTESIIPEMRLPVKRFATTKFNDISLCRFCIGSGAEAALFLYGGLYIMEVELCCAWEAHGMSLRHLS